MSQLTWKLALHKQQKKILFLTICISVLGWFLHINAVPAKATGIGLTGSCELPDICVGN